MHKNEVKKDCLKNKHQFDTLVLPRKISWIEVALVVVTAIMAVASWALVTVTQNNSKKQLRAYVFADAFLVAGITGPSGPIITMDIKNSGQSPALDLKAWSGLIIERYPAPGQFPVPPSDLILSKTNLASFGGTSSGSSVLLRSPRSLTPEEISGLQNNTLAIYSFGRMEYRDIFGKNHFTTFRVYFNTTIGKIGTSAQKMSYCAEGNEAD